MKLYTVPIGEHQFSVRRKTRDEEMVLEMAEGHFDKRCTFRRTDRWLDAGAGIGTFVVAYNSLVEWIVSVEPEMGNAGLLRRNLLINEIDNCTPIYRRALVGNDDEMRPFYINPHQNKGVHSFFKWQPHFQATTVRCININHLLQRYVLNCIKMDVEGAEHELIHAIEDWDAIDEMVIEYHHYILRDVTKIQDDVGFLSTHFDSVQVSGSYGPRKGWAMITCRKAGRA